jgi:FixJ family two-component response regulator
MSPQALNRSADSGGSSRTVEVSVAVIDDDEAIVDAIVMVMAEQRWTVHAYHSGEAFLTDLPTLPKPNCIILDPHLPGISGLEVAEALYHYPLAIPLIVLTAHPGSQITQAVMANGANVMLTKPVTSEVLVHHVRQELPHSGKCQS